MSNQLPGYPVTDTEPPGGVWVWIKIDSGERWIRARRFRARRIRHWHAGFEIEDGSLACGITRWAYLPGESPVERVLALDYDLTSRMSAIGVRRWWVNQSNGATPDDAARAALAALAAMEVK